MEKILQEADPAVEKDEKSAKGSGVISITDHKRDQSPIALADLSGAGLDEIDSSNDGLQRLRLVQPQSSSGGRPGSFENMSTLQSCTEIRNVVLLRAKVIRQHYDQSQGFEGESTLRCWSDDGKIPSPEVESPISTSCTICPKAVWQDNGGRRQLACGELISTIIGIGPSREPHLLDFRGSSVKAARAFHGWLRRNNLPIFGGACDLSADEIKNAKTGSVYHAIKIGTLRVLDPHEVPVAREQWEKVTTYPLKGNPAAAKG